MGRPAPVPAQFAQPVALVFAGGALVRDGCDWQQHNGQFQPLNLDSSVERARVGRWRCGWVGATTTRRYRPLRGAYGPGAVPAVQSGAQRCHSTGDLHRS